MADDEIEWDDLDARRARLCIYIAELRDELKRASAELHSLPTRPRGRPQGSRSRTESVLHNKYATIRAFDMIQKWRHLEKKAGRTLVRENQLPPEEIRSQIIDAACARWQQASPEEIRNRINRLNADPENRAEYGGILYRVRDPEWLDRSDDFLDV